ncbi:hypothetical protein [Streptomyces sp. 4F14]|uniref:hypothetical protein n=1 Tax=Streptomyces sp. 4F14 TaxID=3394380 RepID=UPI003A8B6683
MRNIARTGVCVAAALVGLAGTGAAHSAGTGAATDSTHSVAAACKKKKEKVVAFDHTGYKKCYTKTSWVDWNADGHTDEVFVIAPDRTVWHTWKAASGWQELPGKGRADDMYGPGQVGAGIRSRCIIVLVAKASYPYWQNCFYNGKWHNWTQPG